MLTPPTTTALSAAQQAQAVHAFGIAALILLGFVIAVAGAIIGPKRGRSRRKVGTVAPLRPWKGPDGKVDYAMYLQSGRWAAQRRKLTRKTGYSCKWPGCTVTTRLDCHHMGKEVYNHLGDERMDELVWLCHYHHGLVPTRPHPPLEVQQEFFGVKVKGRRKVAA